MFHLLKNSDDSDVKPDPKNIEAFDPSENLDTWAKGLATHRYAPGNPDGVMNYNFACK